MSSSPLFCTEMALGRLPGFSPKSVPALVLERLSQMPRLVAVTPASRLEVRAAPEMVSIGIRDLDSLTGGLPRGCLTEICGPDSSGRTSVLLAALAAATRREEVCALVDASDALDPASAAAIGVEFGRLLWVRCEGADIRPQPSAVSPQPSAFRFRSSHFRSDSQLPRSEVRDPMSALEQALRVIDLLLQSGGFGMVAVDLGDVPFRIARRIPLTSWFRFQRAVERTPTVLLAITHAPCAQSCAALSLKLRSSAIGRNSSGKLSNISSQLSACSHTYLFEGLKIEGEILRSRLERKPPQSVRTGYRTEAMRA
jgi:recombination protein RecA